MYLSEYLLGLRIGDEIDPFIIESLSNVETYTLDPDMPNFQYSSVSTCKYNYTYVRWGERHMCLSILKPNYELLSTQFQGCHLARFLDNGVWYGCHIHCSKGQKGDQRALWNDYVRYIAKKSVTIFMPDYRLLLNTYDSFDFFDCWGIITPRGICYTVIVKLISTINFPPPIAFYNQRMEIPKVYIMRIVREEPKPYNNLFIK